MGKSPWFFVVARTSAPAPEADLPQSCSETDTAGRGSVRIVLELHISNNAVDCFNLASVTSVRLACDKRCCPGRNDLAADPDFIGVSIQVRDGRAYLRLTTYFLHSIVGLVGKVGKAANKQQPADQVPQSLVTYAAHA